MPKDNLLKPVEIPIKVDFNCKPKTEFQNNLEAIKIRLVSCTTLDQLKDYVGGFCRAVWSDKLLNREDFTEAELDDIIREVFNNQTLPTIMETINCVFSIEGITMQEVTHILRYRGASFSADCTGDKLIHERDCLVPNSIHNSSEFYSRYAKIVHEAKQLYCDMINTKCISVHDARTILPRNIETFYFMRMNLQDSLNFIIQRLDKNVHPEADNIMAYQMYIELLKQYPLVKKMVKLHAPNFYSKFYRSGKSTNWYQPHPDNDVEGWNAKDFIYPCQREELNGTDFDAYSKFNQLVKKYEKQIQELIGE